MEIESNKVEEEVLAQPRTIRAALIGLKNAQKSAPGVLPYTKWINRPLARYVTAMAYKFGVTPKQLTYLSAFISILGLAIIVLAPPGIQQAILAAVLLALGYVVDSADGQLARLTRTSSQAGDWLDHTSDTFVNHLLHAAVIVGFHAHYNFTLIHLVVPLLFVTFGQTTFFAHSLANKIHPQTSTRDTWQSPLRELILAPIDSGILRWSFLLWPWPNAFLLAYSALCLLTIFYSVGSMTRNFRRLELMERKS